MLKQLVLTKFKKHESLTIDFSSGLVVLRGANEAGKSTLLLAISYALYGSRGLPDSLENTVTYGYPVSQLKVELTFTHAGVSYKIVRSKSGATITGGGSTSQGQSEVTNFVTNLFQVKQDVFTKITVSNQNSVKESVEGGVQAVQLIESLSGVDLIDELIDKVQKNLPSGNTASLEQTAAKLESEKAPVLDDSEARKALYQATEARIAAERKLDDAKVRRAALDVNSANVVLQEASFLKGHRDSLLRRQEELRKILDAVPTAVTVTNIPELEKAKLAQEETLKARAALKIFQSLPKPTDTFNGTLQEFRAKLLSLKSDLLATSDVLTEAKVRLAREMGRRINEDSCTLCGKLLQDVPEVVAANSKVDAITDGINEQIRQLTETRSSLTEQISKLSDMADTDSAIRTKLGVLASYVSTLDTVPVQVSWLGTYPAQGALVDYQGLIRGEQAKLDAMLKSKTQRESAEQEFAKIGEELAGIVIPHTELAKATLASADSIDKTIVDLNRELSEETKKEFQAKTVVLEINTRYTSALASYEAQKNQLRELKGIIALYIKHNSLITKLRAARPTVAKQLWVTVLHSVSHYFSTIRGVPSVVAKSDKGFLVDGKTYKDVSGSTIDSLGLAVRMALQKTFLPNLDFIVLDEPASGMDETREAAMLAVLSTCGYEQVIVITHSSVADSYGSQVVRI